MRNLVYIFLRFGHIILFLFLEFFCLYLVVNYNGKQKEIWANSSNIFAGYTSEILNDMRNYIELREKMASMVVENARLKEQLINAGLNPVDYKDSPFLTELQYGIIPAKVINVSVDRPNNYITLDKGRKDGVLPGMGVIIENGIIGIVRNASDDFAQANSILHRRSFISAAIKRTGAFGDLRWTKSNPQYANLMAIENYQDVQLGDTIVTSGFSTHFPPGIMIGKVHQVDLPDGSNFHEIEVLLNNDFNSLQYAYIVKNYKQQQQLELEQEVSNE